MFWLPKYLARLVRNEPTKQFLSWAQTSERLQSTCCARPLGCCQVAKTTGNCKPSVVEATVAARRCHISKQWRLWNVAKLLPKPARGQRINMLTKAEPTVAGHFLKLFSIQSACGGQIQKNRPKNGCCQSYDLMALTETNALASAPSCSHLWILV